MLILCEEISGILPNDVNAHIILYVAAELD